MLIRYAAGVRVRHVAYFVLGMLLSLAWNVPATWALIRYSAATAPRPVAVAAVHVLPGVLMFLCSLALSAYQLSRELRDVGSSVSHHVTRHYARSLSAGLCTGVFGVGPLFLFGLWVQLTGWSDGLAGPPGLAVLASVVLWSGVCLTVPAPLTARLVTARRPGTGVCANCGYDLRATAGRCPECGVADRGGPAAA